MEATIFRRELILNSCVHTCSMSAHMHQAMLGTVRCRAHVSCRKSQTKLHACPAFLNENACHKDQSKRWWQLTLVGSILYELFISLPRNTHTQSHLLSNILQLLRHGCALMKGGVIWP